MEIPWNLIDDNNISTSNAEFIQILKSIKPLYEDPRQIIEEYKLLKRKIMKNLIITSFAIIIVFILSLTNPLLSYIILLSLPLSYILGIFISSFLDEIEIISVILLFLIPALISRNMVIMYSLLASLVPFLWSYISNSKQRIYLSWSSYASNLVGSWEDSEYFDSNVSIKLKRGDARLTPYRADLELTVTMGKLKLRANTSIFALRKGRVGYVITLCVNRRDLLKEKFLISIPLIIEKIKQYLYEFLNRKEWELG